MRKLAMAALAATMVCGSAEAAPSIGDTVTCISNLYDCSVSSATVGSGTEFYFSVGNGNELSADFSQGLLTFSNVLATNRDLTNVRFVFNDSTNAFGQATLLGSTGVTNLSQSNLTLSAGRLTLVFGNNGTATSFAGNGSLQVQLGALPPSVPEAASWAMMVVGFGAVGAATRRRKAAVRFA